MHAVSLARLQHCRLGRPFGLPVSGPGCPGKSSSAQAAPGSAIAFTLGEKDKALHPGLARRLDQIARPLEIDLPMPSRIIAGKRGEGMRIASAVENPLDARACCDKGRTIGQLGDNDMAVRN